MLTFGIYIIYLFTNFQKCDALKLRKMVMYLLYDH